MQESSIMYDDIHLIFWNEIIPYVCILGLPLFL